MVAAPQRLERLLRQPRQRDALLQRWRGEEYAEGKQEGLGLSLDLALRVRVRLSLAARSLSRSRHPPIEGSARTLHGSWPTSTSCPQKAPKSFGWKRKPGGVHSAHFCTFAGCGIA